MYIIPTIKYLIVYLLVEVGRGEELPLVDSSVELLFCWTALHWLDIPAFLAEAQVLVLDLSRDTANSLEHSLNGAIYLYSSWTQFKQKRLLVLDTAPAVAQILVFDIV
jgi:hypothetical protein